MDRALARAALLATLAALPGVALAQPAGPPTGWLGEADAAFAVQPRARLEGKGSFSASRGFVQATQSYSWAPGAAVGLSVGVGTLEFEFSDGTDFALAEGLDSIDDVRVSLPLFFNFGETGFAIVIPSWRFTGEDGVDWEDGDTAGVLAGVAWRVAPNLSIGPGFGAFTSLTGGTDAFPILLIDWNITDRLSLSTGRGLGASQGPGLSLGYAVTDALSVGIAGRYEAAEFRLDDDGPAPGGTGRDEVMPLVATIGWEPNPGVSLSAFAGAEFGGTLTLRDADDRLVERRDYDPVAVFGASIRLRF